MANIKLEQRVPINLLPPLLVLLPSPLLITANGGSNTQSKTYNNVLTITPLAYLIMSTISEVSKLLKTNLPGIASLVNKKASCPSV